MAPPDDYGWAYIDPQRASASADGPETSVQFRYGADSLIPGKFSGSNDLTFQANDLTNQGGPGSGSVLSVTGALYVSGTIYADNYTIREITSTQIAHSGSTTFGDTTDDNHQITGSLWVSHTMSGSHTLHIVSSSSFGDYMTFHHTITGAAAADMSVAAGAGDIHVNKAILNDLRVSGSSVKGANANTTHQITGSFEVSNTAVFAGAVQASQYIKHMGDLDTFIRFQPDDINVQAGGVDFIKITEDDSQDTITFNEGGADVDFRVESDNGTHAIFVDAGSDVVHINQNEAAVTTQIHNDNDVAITVSATEVVINDDSHASIDFRVESDGEDEAIFLDSSANILYVNKGETAFSTRIASVNDVAITVASAGVILNEGGHATNDFRVESDGEDEAIFLDAGANELHINKGETAFATTIRNVNDVAMSVGAAGVIFNQDGHATNDFRVESDNFDHALFVDAGSDTIDMSASLGPLTGSGEVHVNKLVGNDLAVSGSSIKGANANTTHQITGSFEVSTNAIVSGELHAASDIIHLGDGDTKIAFTTDQIRFWAGGREFLSLQETTQDAVIFNEGGSDVDFRVEGENITHALFVQGSDDTVEISGTLGPVSGSGEIHAAKLVANAMELSGTLSSVGRLDGSQGELHPAGTFTLSGSSHAVQIAGGLSASHDVSVEHLYTNDLYVSGTAYGVTVDRANYASSSDGATPRVYSPTGFESSGYLYVSGSSILGDVGATSHQVTGSLEVSGPTHFTSEVHAEGILNVDGLLTATGNVVLGNNSEDTHQVTGSFEVSGPSTFTGVSTHTAHDVFNAGITIKNADASAGYINFYEQSSNGTNVCTFRGKSSMGNITITLPGDTGTVVLEDNTVTLSNKTIASPTFTGTCSDIVVGSDADGTDRSIVFGHSTLKSIIGIDDSQDVFAINTDATFQSVNDLEINSAGLVTLAGALSVGGGTVLGNADADTHQVSGSFEVSGPAHFTDEVHAEAALNVDGLLTATGNAVLGNNSEDTHQVTGSFEVSGPSNFTSITAHEAGLTSTTISGSSTLSSLGAAHVGGTLTMDGAGIVFNVASSAGTVNLQVNDGAGADTAITLGKNGKVTKIGDDTPSNGQLLTWDAAGAKVHWTDGNSTSVSGSDVHYSVEGMRTSGDLNVSGSVTIGPDADGTDRTITFGHSTLKTIMGIDDSANAFVINTDAAFDGTLANNSLSIDASHNMIVAGNITGGGDLTVAGSIVHAGDTDTKIRFGTDYILFDAGGGEMFRIQEAAQNKVSVNGDGEDVDFGVYTTSGQSLLVEGSSGATTIFGLLTATGGAVLGDNSEDTHQVTGSFEVSGPAIFSSFVQASEYIKHKDDLDTHIRFQTDQIDFTAGNVKFLTLDETTQDAFIVNEGSADIDFRVEGASQTGSIFVEASSDSVHLCGNAFTFNDDGVLRIHPDNNAPGAIAIHSRDTAGGDASELKFERYTNGTFVSGDNLGEIRFRGSEDEDGAYYTAASIIGETVWNEVAWADGVSHPGNLVFYTTRESQTSGTEAMRILGSQVVEFAADIKVGGNTITDSSDSRVFQFSSGKVGMGTETAPDSILHIKSTDFPTDGGLKIESTDTTTDTSSAWIYLKSADSTVGSTNYWVRFQDNSGLVGSINSEVAYSTFTGQHPTPLPSGSNLQAGMILKSTGQVVYDGGMANAWVATEIATTEKDKAVVGVYHGLWCTSEDSQISEEMYNYNALGEGWVLVTDSGGDIEVGDYICSSDNNGHGMKQDDDLLHNYTVAKATQPVDFSTVDVDAGLGFKSVLVACTYHAA